jgi:AraC family transcriptional regulator, transcriptional activator of pobA
MIHHIKTIGHFYKLRNLTQPKHPLISVIDVANAPAYEQIESGSVVFGFYVISFKDGGDGGVLGFRAPGQVVKIEPHKPVSSITSGWMLCIHPDFLWHTTLASRIKSYDFFYYDSAEALFLSGEEQTTINTIVANISHEFQKATDKFSQKIAIALIDALLAYIERFYQRQFNTNRIVSHQLLNKLDDLLNKYFDSKKLSKAGLPTVAMVAEELNISPHYLTATLRSITGKNAQQHIHEKLIDKAKELLSATDLSITEIAYVLGFEHLQSFSKLFKSKTNLSPLEFRRSF